MARPRKPTRVLELTGAFRKDPQRRRAREGEPEVTTPLGDAPDHLDEAERARWNEIRKWAPWLGVPDRPIVEQVCALWMLQRKGKATVAQMKLLSTNLTLLGMTPSSRSRVKVPPAKPKANKFRQLA